MKKTNTIDELLEQLSVLLAGATPPDTEILKKLLAHRNNYVVAKAASCAAKFSLKQLIPDLKDGFSRFLDNKIKNDKGCIAKKSIVKAMDQLEHDELAWFLGAATCIQIEPVYGGVRDAATETRALALRSLGRFPWFRVAEPLVMALGDAEPRVRIAAVETIASFSGRESELIVLTKAVAGDASSEVLGSCLVSLVVSNTETGVPFAARFLDKDDETVQMEAAFAIGQSKTDAGFDCLKAAWERWPLLHLKRFLITAIALLRTPSAINFLLDLLDDPSFAEDAFKALQSYPQDVIDKAEIKRKM